MRIPVLYQDHSLLVCEKPVGILSESPGLPDFIAEQTGLKTFPVHRLDQGTGGVIILALSPDICTRMQAMFQSGQIKKEYLAVISGTLPDESGIFEDNLFHDKRTNKTFVVKRMRTGVKHASCAWSSLLTVSSDFGDLSLVRVFLHTGRTHQIRIQFGSRKHPLIGDGRYGSRIKSDVPALWAESVSFPHPLKPEMTVSAVSSVPDRFPWNLFPGYCLHM